MRRFAIAAAAVAMLVAGEIAEAEAAAPVTISLPAPTGPLPGGRWWAGA
ncbi:hypothetical protein [Nocardia panacis]|nr:hypothetical protein [Nocardia panacis]